MSGGAFRPRMAWVHRWGGLVLGPLLVMILVMGTLSVYDSEIDRWMMPATRLALPATTLPLDAVRKRAEALVDPSQSFYLLLPDVRSPFFFVGGRKAGREVEARLDPATGDVLADVGTLGASGFFFPLHFELMIEAKNIGACIVAFAGMAMLWLLASGLVIHRSLFKSLFTLRLGPPLRRLSLDLHTVTGLVALPFHIGITVTGLAIFAAITMPAAVHALYPNTEAFEAQAYDTVARPGLGTPAASASLDAMVAQAALAWGEGQPFYIHLFNPGDRNAVVVVRRAQDAHLGDEGESIYFDGATGAMMRRATPRGVVRIATVLGGAHMMQVTSEALRFLYFLGGVAATLMIATGVTISVEKLPASDRGGSLAEAFALASTLGLLEAVAAYLAANRLVPPSSDHAALEVSVFAATWGVTLVHALVTCGADRPRAWRMQARALSALCGLAVAANWATTGDTIDAALARGQSGVAGVDVALLVTAALSAAFAWRLRAAPVRIASRFAARDEVV